MKEECVLGIPTDRLRLAGLFQGFREFDPDLFAFLLDPAHVEYRARQEAETDPSFKQLIPYVVLKCAGRVFHYTRGGSGTETRLRARRSIGVGGHISASEDAAAADPYRAGMLRELREEVEIEAPFTESWFGMINDDATPVGSVHLGVVHVFELAEPRVKAKEASLAQAGFAPLLNLVAQREEFESWSALVLTALQ